MKSVMFSVSAISLMATSSFASQSGLGSQLSPTASCNFVHSWSSFRPAHGSWDISISRGVGASLFFTPNCTPFQFQNTALEPLVVSQGSDVTLGFGYESSNARELTYFVTAVPRSNLSNTQGDPVPVPNPTPSPSNGKKCVFIINASVPSQPMAYIINYNHAACDYVPGSGAYNSQFILR